MAGDGNRVSQETDRDKRVVGMHVLIVFSVYYAEVSSPAEERMIVPVDRDLGSGANWTGSWWYRILYCNL